MSNGLIDASKAFADRRALAGVFSDGAYLSDTQVTETAGVAAQNLFDEVDCAVPGVIAERFACKELIRAKIVIEGSADEDISPAPLLDANKVHECADGPTLYITDVFLNAVSGLLEPYFEAAMDDDEQVLNRSVAQLASVRAAIKLGIAGWVFDELDPRTTNQKDKQSITGASLEAGLNGLIHAETDINSIMDVLRYRFMGYFGFSDLLVDKKFQTTRNVYEAYFDSSGYTDEVAGSDSAFALKFAFAHMLSRAEAHELIRRLVNINRVIDKYTQP